MCVVTSKIMNEQADEYLSTASESVVCRYVAGLGKLYNISHNNGTSKIYAHNFERIEKFEFENFQILGAFSLFLL